MFIGFHHEKCSIKADGGAVSRESFFHQFLATREMDPLDMLCKNPNSVFGKFCTSKYLVVVHPKLSHRLAYSFDPNVKVFQVMRGSEFSEAAAGIAEASLVQLIQRQGSDNQLILRILAIPSKKFSVNDLTDPDKHDPLFYQAFFKD
ncbi:hypothetical protein NC652_032675 [Populus alba x Populus x berolinensis]|nr:hypothetical protein NC652_032675 [Populus alba x Populus x berolinensis]